MPPRRLSFGDAVIAAIKKVPRGKVTTYGAVARAAGKPRGARQVAQFLSEASGVAWQRVLGSGGAIKLGGDHAFEQRFRLEAEGVRFRGKRVDMAAHEHIFTSRKDKPHRKKR